jgi:hypothetical protein
MPKMQKIPNLLLLVGKDHQSVYFTMLSPFYLVQVEHKLMVAKISFLKLLICL